VYVASGQNDNIKIFEEKAVFNDQPFEKKQFIKSRKRSLIYPSLGYDDPKDVVEKEERIQLLWSYPMIESNLPRPINILALGGDATWGSMLQDRSTEAYPWLIGFPNVNHVDNLALPVEMGAYYHAMCLQSLIPDFPLEKNYDVILLDFISSELEGFSWLLYRLRERYPEAILVYVHLWPLKALIRQADTGTNFLGLDTNVEWEWIHEENSIHNFHPDMTSGTKAEVLQVGGHFYHLPLPESPKDAIDWFSADGWHLSAKGHLMVANGVLVLLYSLRNDVFRPKRLGSFGEGDQCYNWLFDGQPKVANYSGAEMGTLLAGESTTKWTSHVTHSANHVDVWLLHVDPTKDAAIEFENKFSFRVPIVIAYMSNRELAPLYSSVEFFLEGQPAVSVDPNFCYSIKHLPKVKHIVIGMADPGNNLIVVKTIDRQVIPFKVAGIFLNKGSENVKADPVTANVYLQGSSTNSQIEAKNTGLHVIFCFMQIGPRYTVNYTLIEAIIEDTKKRLAPDWTVHVITSGDEAVQRISAHSDVQVVDYRDAAFSHLLARFRGIYVPQSLNEVEYEKFCFYRWIMIKEYFKCLKMRGIPVEHILALDTDALALENPLLADNTLDWKTIETYRLINGAAAVWSFNGLKSFIDFMFDLYYNREKAVNFVTKHGEILGCHEQRSQLVPCFKDEQGNKVMYHISDMHVYNVWVEEAPIVRVQASQKNMKIHIVNIFPDQEYLFSRRGSDIILEGDERKVGVIHFMYDSKVYIPEFEAFLHENSSSPLILSTHKK
jgi:hypothetical protein